jgi:PAS domain-containing protein
MRGSRQGRPHPGRKNRAGYQTRGAFVSAGTAGPGDRALLHLVVDAALDAVIVMDAGGLVVHCNRQAEVIFGWTRDEAGSPWPTW